MHMGEAWKNESAHTRLNPMQPDTTALPHAQLHCITNIATHNAP